MQIKEIFEKNGYNKFFDRCLATFLTKIYSKKAPKHTVPKKDLFRKELFRKARSTSEKTI